MSPTDATQLKIRLTQAIAGLLVASAALLSVSGSLAQNSESKTKPTPATQQALASPTPTPAPSCNWPPKTSDEQCQVIRAFATAIRQSTDLTDIRDKLLKCDPAVTCSSAKQVVNDILKKDGSKVVIPEDVLLRFYFDPNRPSGFVPLEKSLKSTPSSDPKAPETHCQISVSVPMFKPDSQVVPADHWDDKAIVLATHLRCCYEPWAPILSNGQVCK
jgi:hypothetical protein